MEDTMFDAAIAAVLKRHEPTLYQAIAAAVDAGAPRSRIIEAIRRAGGRNAALVNNAAITTADYLITCRAVRKRSGGNV